MRSDLRPCDTEAPTLFPPHFGPTSLPSPLKRHRCLASGHVAPLPVATSHRLSQSRPTTLRTPLGPARSRSHLGHRFAPPTLLRTAHPQHLIHRFAPNTSCTAPPRLRHSPCLPTASSHDATPQPHPSLPRHPATPPPRSLVPTTSPPRHLTTSPPHHLVTPSPLARHPSPLARHRETRYPSPVHASPQPPTSGPAPPGLTAAPPWAHWRHRSCGAVPPHIASSGAAATPPDGLDRAESGRPASPSPTPDSVSSRCQPCSRAICPRRPPARTPNCARASGVVRVLGIVLERRSPARSPSLRAADEF
ncbi:hypothetical protein amrb99_72980 [Actinomadura sp. RB99]|nr:hypothetical protein [Actinomadura sp. RB99]